MNVRNVSIPHVT